MTGVVEARHQAIAEGRFVPVVDRSSRKKKSKKIECVECNDRGLPDGFWMDKHVEGHTTCPDCGKARPISTLNKHLAHRSHRAS